MSTIIDIVTTILIENIVRVLNNNKNDFNDYAMVYGIKVSSGINDVYIYNIQNEISQNPLFIDFQDNRKNSGVEINLINVIQITDSSYFCEVKISKVKNIDFLGGINNGTSGSNI